MNLANRKGKLLVTLTLALILTASTAHTLQRLQQSEPARVKAVVNSFMQARLQRNDAAVRPFLTVSFHRQYTNQPKPTLIGGANPHYHSYRVVGIKQQDQNWIAIVRVEEDINGFWPAGYFYDYIAITPVYGVYRVSSVKSGSYHAYR